MSYLLYIILLLVEIFIGYSILTMLNIKRSRFSQLSISAILGIAIVSTVPFTLELLHIPLLASSIFLPIALICIILLIVNRKHFKQLKFNTKFPKLELYELPWLILIGMLLAIPLVYSTLIPPVPRDLLSGPEPIAEYALKEHTFINSVFNQEMPFNNGPFKSLYLPSLQLIYKLIGFPFGKIWMPTLAIAFIVFLYSEIRSISSPVVTGLLISFLMFCSDLYGYTYLVLYDYSNMILYFLSLFFLYSYLDTDKRKYIWISALFMGLATYVRPETFILSAFICGLALLYQIIRKKRQVKYLLPILSIGLLSGVAYLFSSYIYLNYYVPVFYDVDGLVNKDITNLSPFWDRLSEITGVLIFSKLSAIFYSYIFHFFLIMVAAELIVYKKFTKQGGFWLAVFLTTYIAIAFVGFLLPLADLINTTKRALFKTLPVIVIYLANNQLVQLLYHKTHKYLNQEKPTINVKAKKGYSKKYKRA